MAPACCSNPVILRRAYAPRIAALLIAALGLLVAATQLKADGPGPLEGRFFGRTSGDVLVIVLHGDLSNGANAEYQYDIARRIADSNAGIVAFGMIRPGYRDDAGRRSTGSNSNRSDHYTARNNQLVAQTIENLRASTGARRVIAIGHSGGAAQLGAIIGRFPGLIDSAVLVSCPCDLRRWRQMRGRGSWNRSQSPSQFANSVPAATRVVAVTGSADDNTFPVLAADYIERLVNRGVPASFIAVPGAGHSYTGELLRAAERAVRQEIRR